MSDAFRPVSAGDRIKPRINAEWMNGVNRAVNTLRGGDIDLAQQQLSSIVHDGTTVAVVNRSGFDIDNRGGVLKLDGLYFSFADRPNQVYGEPELKGITPTGSSDHFVVVAKPVKNNKPTIGIHTGLAFCRLDYTDEDGEHDKARPDTTVDNLISDSSGAPIIWRELEDETGPDTTGVQWALVLLGAGGGGGGDLDVHFARVTTTISPATSFAVADWGEGEAVAVDSDGNDFGDPFAIFTRFGEQVAEDTPIWWVFIGEQRVLLVPGCGPLPSGGA